MLGLFVERSWEVGCRMLEQTLRHTDPANDLEKHPLISGLEFRKSEMGFIAMVHCTLDLGHLFRRPGWYLVRVEFWSLEF